MYKITYRPLFQKSVLCFSLMSLPFTHKEKYALNIPYFTDSQEDVLNLKFYWLMVCVTKAIINFEKKILILNCGLASPELNCTIEITKIIIDNGQYSGPPYYLYISQIQTINKQYVSKTVVFNEIKI